MRTLVSVGIGVAALALATALTGPPYAGNDWATGS